MLIVARLLLYLFLGQSMNCLAFEKMINKEGNIPSSLVGKWYNELGSIMEIFDGNGTSEGVLIGRYNSYVGNASRWYTLRGTYDKDGTENGGTIAWTVTFNNAEHGNSNSTCAWSGQRQIHHGNSVICTTWLLTSQTKTSDDWESTTINQDLFTRCYPKDENIRNTLIANDLKDSH